MSKKGKGGGVDLSAVPKASFVEGRLALFDELYAKQVEEFTAKSAPIKITMPDKSVKEAQSWVTTPQDIAAGINKKLGEDSIVAKVDGVLWDMGRPFEQDCSLEILKFDDEEAKDVFWHSSAHVLGYAMERFLSCKLSIGPPIEGGGFFYEADGEGRAVSEADYPGLETACKTLTSEKAPYQRLVCPKEKAIEMFAYNPYKADILRNKVPEGGHCTIYKCGELIDPCRGPHLLHTGKVKSFAVTKNSCAYWQGKAENEILQRVYGIAFPSETLMKEWKKFMEQAALANHRYVGTQQQLWMFHPYAPGCAFFYPKGARLYNGLMDFIRKQYRVRGFDEVMTPNVYNKMLWEKSGHWAHYAENMFKIEIEKEIHSLKPMNCPGHMLMFANQSTSYKDLPRRYADFGVLHRNEASGSLSGLTRVRRFQQDDAHIFIRKDQITAEIERCLDFMEYAYKIFGFKFHLNLSTRNPEKWMGNLQTWDYAEACLARAMSTFCGLPHEFEDMFDDNKKVQYDGSAACIKRLKRCVEAGNYPEPKQYWLINPEDAAFYGPKIDIQVEDCMRRRHQCATIQLDFCLPEKFELSYVMSPEEKAQREEADDKEGVDGALTASGKARPVVVHRAVLGSVERMLAILTEHYAGKWPFWLSPRQIIMVPIDHVFDEYAMEVKEILHQAGFYVEADCGDDKFPKKVRNAQLAQYNIILVVGPKELENRSVNIRTRDNKQHGEKTIDEAVTWLKMLADTYDSTF